MKKYLGMKGSTSREFQKKYPKSARDKRKDVRLPSLSPEKSRQPVYSVSEKTGNVAYTVSSAAGLKSAAHKITNKITEAFPRIEGYVVDVREGKVYLSLGTDEEIKAGALLDLIRRGRQFKHPLTGQVLGVFEDNIGVLKITQVKENYSVAEIVSLRKGFKAKLGDTGRISSARIKLAVLPFYAKSAVGLDPDALTTELWEGLKKTGRFDLYDLDTLKVWMLEQGLKPSDLSDEMAVKRVLGGIPSEWYLVNSVRELQGVEVVESSLISSYNEKPVIVAKALVEKAEASPQAAAAQRKVQTPQTVSMVPAAGEVFRQNVRPSAHASVAPSGDGKKARFQGEYWTSREFDAEIVGLDVGDVDGDGENELVVATVDRVEILKWDGENFRSIHTYSRRSKGDNYIVSLDLADINGNGVEEIYVTNFVKEEIRSFVLEISGNKLKVLQQDLFQYLRVVDLPGQEPILLSQMVYPGSEDSLLLGKIERYGWKGKKLRKISSDGFLKRIPKKYNVFSITLGDLNGDGAEDIVALSDMGKLGLYDKKGDMLWGSSDTYGGKIVRLRAEESVFKMPGKDTGDAYEKSISPANMRMILRDLDGDGVSELIIPRNIHAMGGPMKGIGGFGNSYLMGLSWNGVTLVEEWQTEKTGGYVTDISMGDVDNDGQDEVVAAVAFKSGYMTLGRDSAVYVFEFQWQ